ncbi:MAG: serine hydrolase [Cyanobacteria bacterium P01_F01_bin.150]
MLFRIKTLKAIGIAIILALSPSAVKAEGNGVGWTPLSDQIDQKIETFLEDNSVVGMTVAVSKEGKLLYSKGHGIAHLNEGSPIQIPMTRYHRSRNGSVAKAAMTGPAAYKAMLARGYDPKTTKVYGDDSIFGDRYLTYQRSSVRRFRPILATAIAPDDRVYTWYEDGTYSIGTSADLTAHQDPQPFRVADGMKVTDIHAMAIAGSTSRVYTWYTNGAWSVGTSRDLDAYETIEFENGKPTRTVRFPEGNDGDRKSMLDVIDVAIAKSNDHIYVWYADGTVSSGTSGNFGRYFKNRSYTVPTDTSWRFLINGIGIADDDRIYVWYGNGKASSGYSSNLSAYRAPYNFQHAFSGELRENLFKKITVQHLFDHTSGLHRSGDVPATARLFPEQSAVNGEPTYDLIHKHFLTTRKIRWEPGTRYSYSNHGMGLFTLIIEELTGKTYQQYVEDNYLQPMGLKGVIRPQRAILDGLDSSSYEVRRNSSNSSVRHVKLPNKNSTTGLAAGGWTASAEALLDVTRQLADQYSYDEIDSFGWRKVGSSKLEHGGRTGGGAAEVVMFPDTYQSSRGLDVAGLHIAIAANTSFDDDANEDMDQLLKDIASAVGNLNVPTSVDYWQN